MKNLQPLPKANPMHLLFDTNVVSEAMKDNPNPQFKTWIDTCSLDDIYFSAPGVAELNFGMLNEKRRAYQLWLKARIESWLLFLPKSHILPFDMTAAQEYGDIKNTRKSMGRPVENVMDLQMAAIARVHDMAIVTRNVKDFEHVGLVIINPWDEVAGVREPRPSYGLAQAA